MQTSYHPLKQIHPKFNKKRIVNLQGKLYIPKYTKEMLQGLIRPHRPSFKGDVRAAKYCLRITQKDIKNWNKFIARKDSDVASPLTYYNSAGAFGLFDILKQVNVNFSTILHLRGDVEILKPNEPISEGVEFTLASHLAEIIVRKKQCILVVATDVFNQIGELVRHHKDFWFVKNCSEKHLSQLKSQSSYDPRNFSGISRRLSKLSMSDSGSSGHATIAISKAAGHEFAKVSGDFNIIHTTNWGARLTGQKRAFLQGYGMMNHCIHKLTQIKKSPLNQISITFCRPVLVDQDVHLYTSGNKFEVCDENGSLLTAGTFS
ncbi:MaoC family dehydratase N-terminal domain-containing protein [Pseudobacteriovorax antillogorgiicola]|uniref:N-terminal half of MaoC dehydratase n=1 Tax=Pseudobacteriovorax antillogorgiicola TaxID=1513793 RepID=A0A1Y6BLN7_9BACT|nr:MaoC family dehydratase N-terminal domain-containing protein [Pseudobacteriovorax antillogorgiicola]TCS56180.1 MaoC dehydratase-like protein [Pseudobacteriovorax antillogorgiicola]SMF08966.1 N-terminal half of MaoC dehydratase [Pseudobacteriovorax antillogorgiicola]